MNTRIVTLVARIGIIGAVCCLPLVVSTAADNPKGIWTDPKDSTLPVDFKFQGEYVSDGTPKVGCQVISLGDGKFQAVVYPGGLPADGWDMENKILMDGALEGEKTVTFMPTAGKRNYLAKKPDEFCATTTFPPKGQKDYSGSISGDTLTIKTDDGKSLSLKKTVRKSPTEGAKPPEGAIVLFDGSNAEEWTSGTVDQEQKVLSPDGKDLRSKKTFTNYTAHCEFFLPYVPEARGQARGNSGFYQVDLYEVQILDSFGLNGENNECGAPYSKIKPKFNMCYPPLTWQTYDVDFTNAVKGEDGKKAKNARITVKHNGVVIVDDKEIPGPTGGGRIDQKPDPEGTPGPFQLQWHGQPPMKFRNIWVVEKK